LNNPGHKEQEKLEIVSEFETAIFQKEETTVHQLGDVMEPIAKHLI